MDAPVANHEAQPHAILHAPNVQVAVGVQDTGLAVFAVRIYVCDRVSQGTTTVCWPVERSKAAAVTPPYW